MEEQGRKRVSERLVGDEQAVESKERGLSRVFLTDQIESDEMAVRVLGQNPADLHDVPGDVGGPRSVYVAGVAPDGLHAQVESVERPQNDVFIRPGCVLVLGIPGHAELHVRDMVLMDEELERTPVVVILELRDPHE